MADEGPAAPDRGERPSAGRWALVAGAALFSTGGAAIKATSLGGWQVACLRSGLAALVLALLVPASRGWPGWRGLGVGLAYAATLSLYAAANKLTTAAAAIFLQSTAPLYVLLLGPRLLGEARRAGDLPVVAVMGAGLALVLVSAGEPLASAPDPGLGNLLAAGAGLSWALTVMGLRSFGAGQRVHPLQPVVVGNLLACLLGLPSLMVGPLDPGTTDLVLLLYLGAVQIGLAYVLVTAGLARVAALEASLLLLVEPALAPLWAWWSHGEQPAPGTWAGGAVVLATCAWLTLRRGPRTA